MSRVANQPIPVPAGVDIQVNNGAVKVKGSKGEMGMDLPVGLSLAIDDGVITVVRDADTKGNTALAGTLRALVNNFVVGVSAGFEKKLELVGVGYRAQAKGKTLTLQLGFSHPIDFPVPEGITIETPSQTEVVIKGVDKQVVGQVAAVIRSYRPPEPYKGKGVRYSDERVLRKEAKKK